MISIVFFVAFVVQNTAMTAPQPQPRPARLRRKAWWYALPAVLLIAMATMFFFYISKRAIAPSGGLYFFKPVQMAVPHFRQDDLRWSQDRLGWTDGTLGDQGCAVAASAMVLAYYGVDTDPGRLNGYLSAIGGYTPEGWIYWEAAANLAPARVRMAYESLPSYYLIDRNLLHGNPVIVRLRLANGITHFVVVSGKRGFDYMITDPMAEENRGAYPLRDLRSKIEALRYYEKIWLGRSR